MKFHFLLPATALLLAGCSDPLAPTESNFRKAIEAKLANEPICETAHIFTLPLVRKFEGPPPDYYLGLNKLGLVDIKKDTSSFPNSNTVTPANHWTDEKGFCLAVRKLEKIVRWTTPAAIDGMMVTRVTFEWSAVPAEWATPDVMKALDAKPPQHATEEIVLTKMNDGWRARS